jgi:hypothetical protein
VFIRAVFIRAAFIRAALIRAATWSPQNADRVFPACVTLS